MLPKKAHSTDSGFDLSAHTIKRLYVHGGGNGERMIDGTTDEGAELISKRYMVDGKLQLQYLERALIGTGIKATAGVGYELQIRPRSGLALKRGLTVLNTPGTIDEAYREEIGVVIINNSRQVQTIEPGERIAQLVVMAVELPEIEVVGTLPEPHSDRDGGFGSTGVK